MISNHYQVPNMGWVCSKCQASLSPSTPSCLFCVPNWSSTIRATSIPDNGGNCICGTGGRKCCVGVVSTTP